MEGSKYQKITNINLFVSLVSNAALYWWPAIRLEKITRFQVRNVPNSSIFLETYKTKQLTHTDNFWPYHGKKYVQHSWNKSWLRHSIERSTKHENDFSRKKWSFQVTHTNLAWVVLTDRDWGWLDLYCWCSPFVCQICTHWVGFLADAHRRRGSARLFLADQFIA